MENTDFPSALPANGGNADTVGNISDGYYLGLSSQDSTKLSAEPRLYGKYNSKTNDGRIYLTTTPDSENIIHEVAVTYAYDAELLNHRESGRIATKNIDGTYYNPVNQHQYDACIQWNGSHFMLKTYSGMKGDWYRAHLNDYTVKNYGVTAAETPDGAVLSLRQSFGWSIHQPFAYMDVKYIISENGLDIQFSAEFSNKVTFLPRFGIRLFLPKAFDRVDYFGYGPYESYIDKHRASYMGNFSAKLCDMHEDYIRPQENGSHFGCRHMTVTDGITSLKFTSDEDFSFSASEYTQEELSEKRHNFKLEKCGSSVICVDSQMAGVGSNACGPALAEKYRLPLPVVSAHMHIDFSAVNDK